MSSNYFFEYIDGLLKIKNKYVIILSTQGEWWKSFNNDISLKMFNFGLKTNLSELRNVSYIAVIDKGQVIEEKISEKNKIIVYKNIKYKLEIVSQTPSMELNNNSNLRHGVEINKKMVSFFRRGLSIVVYDEDSDEIIDSVTFDTCLASLPVFKAEFYCKMLLSQISELQIGFGYTIAQWLYDNGHTKINVIIEPQFTDIIKAIMLPIKMNDNIQVINYYTTSETKYIFKYSYNLFFKSDDYNPLDLEQIDSAETVIYIAPYINPIIQNIIIKKGVKLFILKDLIERAHLFITHDYIPLKIIHENPGVSAVLFTYPALIQDKSYEARSICKHITMTNQINELNKIVNGEGDREGKNICPYIKEDSSCSIEDWLEIIKKNIPDTYNDENGSRIFKDKETKYVNVKNGHRVTEYQPEKYDNTIFIVGGCQTFGVYHKDNQTSSSQLQKILNEKSLGKIYKVENYGHYLFSNLINNLRVVNQIKFKKGDIVMLAVNGANPNSLFPRINFSKMELPDNYGHLFVDNVHASPNLTKFIAEKMFEYLYKNDFFANQTAKQSYKTKQIPLYGLQVNISNIDSISSDFKENLEEYKISLLQTKLRTQGKIGSIVMNCNPFTLGHRYLIEFAASQVKHLYIFAVEEDKSIFPFNDRFELIKAGTKDLENVTVLPSGKFIISSITFSDYFNKSEIQGREIDPSMDVKLFAKEIAPVLGINVRFAGEEPIDMITKQYNDSMRKILPDYGIEFIEIKRKESSGAVISASRVRALLKDKDFDAISQIVPKTTLDYLKSKY